MKRLIEQSEMTSDQQINSDSPSVVKIDAILRLLMPNGTSDTLPPEWGSFPGLANAFGVAAYLIKMSGIAVYVDPQAMHRDCAALEDSDYFSPGPEFYTRLEKCCRKVRKIIQPIKGLMQDLELDDRDRARSSSELRADEETKQKLQELDSRIKKAKGKIKNFIQPYWQELLSHRELPLNKFILDEKEKTRLSEKQLAWWDCCLKLLIAADTLCEGIGFPIHFSGEGDILSLPAYDFVMNSDKDVAERDGNFQATPSLAPRISRDIAVVLPKSVTPGVGCTVRSLSHNLALLPPIGQTGAQWVYAPHTHESDRHPLNLLVIPIPYFFHGRAFHVDEIREEHGWGSFSIRSLWLDDVGEQAFVRFVRDLCQEAALQAGKVDAIVFPEAAISEKLYEALVKEIETATKTSIFHEVEFIVGGLTDKDGDPGNFVGCTVFSGSGSPRETFGLVRAKHHRWKIDSEQIETYRLSHVLNRSLDWWEKLPPHDREIHFFRFRNSSSFTALICEDLARIDPCQEVLRAVGPDLIISILMDSAQHSERWPARYATVLAEDPGCSVLTVTSQALIYRATQRLLATNKNIDESSLSTSIGLWKDSSSRSGVPIHLPEGYAATLLTLSNEKRRMRTLDGRDTIRRSKWTWRLTDQRPIKLTANPADPYPHFGKTKRILGHEDL